MLPFYFVFILVLIFVRFWWHDLLYLDAFLHLPQLKRNPFTVMSALVIESDPASREDHLLLNNHYPGSSYFLALLRNKTPSVRVVAFTSFIFVSRENASCSLSLIDEISAAWKAHSRAKSLLDRQ